MKWVWGRAKRPGGLGTENGGGVAQPLLSILPGGPATNQIANPAGLTDSKGNAVTCTRASTKYCRKSLVSDPANLAQNPEQVGVTAFGWSGSLGTSNVAAAPDGTFTASRVQLPGVNLFSGTQQTIANSRASSGGTWASKTVTFSLYVKSNTGSNQVFSIWVTQGGVADYYSQDLTATTSWQRFSFTQTFSGVGTSQAQYGIVCGSALAAADLQCWGGKFEEASSATAYVSPMLVSMAANVPSVEPEGLLSESAATNLCLQSQTLDNASWGKAAAAVTADQAIAPDGTLTADLVALTSGNISSANVAAAAVVYTGSIYLRAVSGTTSSVSVQIMDATAGFAVLATTTPTLTTSWQRVAITLPIPAVVAHNLILVVTSGVATVSVYAWGGQVEAQGWATSYIPTTTVSVTRAADVCSIANPLPSAFPFYAGVTAQPTGGALWSALSRVPLSVGIDSSNNSARFADSFWADYDGTGNFAGLNSGAYSAFGTASHRMVGGKTALTSYSLFYDGTSTGTPTGAGTGMVSQPANIYLGGGGTTWFNGWVSNIRVGTTYASVK